MNNALAYHAVVHAVEGRKGVSAGERFALLVHHSLDGHLPYGRYWWAGYGRRRRGISSGAIEAAVGEWLDLDLNPASQAIRGAGSAAASVRAYNAYNAAVNLGVRTSVDERGGSPTRTSAAAEDPDACRIASIAALGRLIAQSETGSGMRGVASVAHQMGLGSSASAEAGAVLEDGGWMPVPDLARALGCSTRALQRRLRDEGLSPETIRSSARLVRATGKLSGGHSLTSIAVDEGFSDLAHMSRAFKAACGMTPTLLRGMLSGNAKPPPEGASDSPADVGCDAPRGLSRGVCRSWVGARPRAA